MYSVVPFQQKAQVRLKTFHVPTKHNYTRQKQTQGHFLGASSSGFIFNSLKLNEYKIPSQAVIVYNQNSQLKCDKNLRHSQENVKMLSYIVSNI